MTAEDRSLLLDLLLESMPWNILSTICQSSREGITESEILKRVSGRLPSVADIEIARTTCMASLAWFRKTGDISRAGNQRYVALPPYLVFSSANGGFVHARLYGDIRLDDEVRKVFTQYGLRLVTQSVTLDNPHEVGGSAHTVGILRFVLVPEELVGDFTQSLRQIGVLAIDTEVLATELPSTANLIYLPQSAMSSDPPAWGLWFVYDPRPPGSNRWHLVASRSEGTGTLYRWQPSDDWRGEQHARYFLSEGQAYVAELSETIAALWTFQLDVEFKRPRSVWVDGHTIWLPEFLPDAYHQWLRLLSSKQLTQGLHSMYVLTVAVEPVVTHIRGRLGLQMKHGFPHHN